MVNKKLLFYAGIFSCLILISCNQQQNHSTQLNFSGAYALYPLNLKWSEEYKKTHADLIFNVQPGGAGKGLTDALSGNADAGMFSREISDNELNKGVWYIALAKDAVFPTINSANPFIDSLKLHGITKDALKNIFIDGKISTWEDLLGYANAGKPHRLNVYARSDASGAAESWAQFFNMKQENLKGIAMLGDPGIADAVKKDANGIGFNNTQYLFDINSGNKIPGIEILPFDANGNGKIDSIENFYTNLSSVERAALDGNYPSPPVRELYFVCKEKPANQKLLDYFKWVLTDGQQYIKNAGYIPLPAEMINEQLKKLE
jgi:phosphate transport system substrate-binding protein